MTGPASLVIQVRVGSTVVHQYQRATAQPSAENVAKMLYAACGWMQAYAGAVNDDQWHADVLKAAAAQALSEQQDDGMVSPQAT